ncbi:MAG TPA: hypothetical protein GXX19_03445 [Syntrophomonadaceae bacterium]|nr:hypothetical protein [Syntrophomonadaceae bacterium]
MKPITGLRRDHAAITVMMGVLEKLCAKCWQGEEINPNHLDKVVEFIEVFIDRYHHRKEEELFAALRKAGIPLDGGELGTIPEEHASLRRYIRGMREAAVDYRKQPVSGMYKFFINAREFGSVYLRHLDKEKNMLYPSAEWVLTGGEQEVLGKAFERIDGETGPARLVEFHLLANRLKDIYC